MGLPVDPPLHAAGTNASTETPRNAPANLFINRKPPGMAEPRQKTAIDPYNDTFDLLERARFSAGTCRTNEFGVDWCEQRLVVYGLGVSVILKGSPSNP